MTEKSKKPRIRFKGFTDAWEQRKLGEAIDVRSGKDYKHLQQGDIPVYGTGGYMLSVNEALSYQDDAIGIGRKGTIDKPYVLKAPFWTVDTLFYAIPKQNNDLLWLFGVFQKIDWKSKDESTGVPSLSKNAINGIDIVIPKQDEQQIIGKCFARLDNLITLHQRKYDKLTAIKKALLEKMFPADGETVPKIRFKGFSDAWEQRKLESIANSYYGGGTPDTMNTSYWNGSIAWIQSSDLTEHDVTNVSVKKRISEKALKQSATQLIPANSIAVITRVGVGKVAFLPFSYATSQDFVSLSNLNVDGIFATYLLYLRLQKDMNMVQGTSIKGITKEELLAKIISTPFSNKEQQKIGGFFQRIDNLITLHQRQLEKLKNIKSALLEKMFV